MVNQALLDYVKKELARGAHEDRLRQVLLENDWPEFEINEAFEKAKQAEPVVKPAEKPVEEKPPEEILKETIPAEKPEEPVLEEEPEEIKKVPVIENIQKIVTNKVFIIAVIIAIIIVLGYLVYFFIIPLVFEGGEGIGTDSSINEEAKNACMQYCNSNLCGLFVSPGFPQPELQGKNCLDLGVQCKKCEVEY